MQCRTEILSLYPRWRGTGSTICFFSPFRGPRADERIGSSDLVSLFEDISHGELDGTKTQCNKTIYQHYLTIRLLIPGDTSS